MSKLTIWGRHNSTNVRKALWAAHELGLTFDSKIVGLQHGGTRTPSYLAMNPMAQIPTLQDGDLVVCESNTIVRYLFAAYSSGEVTSARTDSSAAVGSKPVFPSQATPATRAVGDRWMDWSATTLAGPFKKVFWPVVRMKPEERDPERIKKAVADVEELLKVPEEWLGGRAEGKRWFSGDSFGAGDISMGVYAYAWFEMPIERKPMPNLEAWYAKLKEREAYRTAVMTPLT